MTTSNVTISEAAIQADRPLLEIRDLAISFKTGSGEVQAVRNAHLTIMPGETVAATVSPGMLVRCALRTAWTSPLPVVKEIARSRISSSGRSA